MELNEQVRQHIIPWAERHGYSFSTAIDAETGTIRYTAGRYEQTVDETEDTGAGGETQS